MANRAHHRTGPVEDLRLTIDCLPVATREAMLDGVQRHERIIVGAYVDREGGVCPMLVAHQSGGRTAFLPFAKSWDRFTKAKRGVRRATRRELDILIGQLQASLLSEADVNFDRAIEEHRELVSRHEPAREADPTGEIIVRRRRRLPRWGLRRKDCHVRPSDDGRKPSTGTKDAGAMRQPAARRPDGLDVVARADEHDLGNDAGGGDAQQIAHCLGDVLRADHLICGNVLLDEVGHRGVHPPGAQCRRLDP